MMRILVIDDEEFVRLALADTLKASGCEVTTAAQGQAGIDRLREQSFDCVITDLRMPGKDGLEVLRWVHEHQPDVDVIVLTGHADVKHAVEAIKSGAWDYLVKDIPFDTAQVAAALTKLSTMRRLRQENTALRFEAAARIGGHVEGKSAAWQSVLTMIRKIAPSQAPVLIQGETGSGKEVVARILHSLSPRQAGPFLAVNCGALHGHILESELFGHEKGAFTGASATKWGLIAAAEGGTLFLDEIGDMSGPMQVSLLRVLDCGEYRQVGGTRTLHANVRFLAASNKDLQELVLQGRFRDDLLYRINTVPIRVPPLRDRREDIPALAGEFVHTIPIPGHPVRSFSPDALAVLTGYAWPGNVRELWNVVERILLLSSSRATHPIAAEEVTAALPPRSTKPDTPTASASESLEDAEKAHILLVLDHHHGNKTHTAKALQIDYKTLLTKLKNYGLGGEPH
ncbi:MAG: sigma-54-dependent Fis family transcriptional regulator [Nitrospirae bacterium]|nr:sigma-54-dependent Fis family transcriptional regulator [Nitrospirota bacterium]